MKAEFDCVVIGAGPAGLAAAQYAARSGLSVAAVDFSAGGQAARIAELENYPGVFPAASGAAFCDTLKAQAESFGAKILSAKISSIDKTGGKFLARSEGDEFLALSAIVATGAAHRALGAKGEKEFAGSGVSYCATCDGPFFKGKDVIVAGGGDSACSEALYLSTLASSVTIVHRRGALRAAEVLAARVKSNPRVKVIYNATVEEIRGKGHVESVVLKNTLTGQTEEARIDGVFIFVGMKARSSLVDFLDKDENGCVVTDERMRTKVPGLFAAGDVRAKPLRQIVTAVSDGAVAAQEAAAYVREARGAEGRR